MCQSVMTVISRVLLLEIAMQCKLVQYADDTIFLIKPDEVSFPCLMRCLNNFL